MEPKISWHIEEREIDELKNWKKNPRKITGEKFEEIKKSVNERGFHDVIKVDTDLTIISGNQRKRALKELGLTKVKVLIPDRPLTEQERDIIAVESNRHGGVFDFDMLANEFEISDLLEAGFSEEELAMGGFDLYPEEEKDNAIPETPTVARTQVGDVYELGAHRVLCGSSTSREDVDRLMNGRMADMIFTSPPYNIGKGKMYENYEDDLSDEEYEKFLVDVLSLASEYTKGLIFWNVSYNKNNKKYYLRTLANLVEKTGLSFRELVTWDKDWAMPLSVNDSLTRQTEQILVFETEEDKEIEYVLVMDNAEKPFIRRTQKKLSNYWKTKSGVRNLENHKACYPVELVVKAITISTKEGELMFEPFCGSGTNIVAAQKTGRVCYGMELDPLYVDVIVDRYCQYTGNYKVKKNGQDIEWEPLVSNPQLSTDPVANIK